MEVRLKVTKSTLIETANKILKSDALYETGMKIYDASMEGNVLVLRGECFINPDSSPTSKTIVALEVYERTLNQITKAYILCE